MWSPIALVIVSFVNFIYLYNKPNVGYHMHTFGERVDGDILSYRNKGALPLFNPVYKIKVEPTRQDVEKNLSLVTVEYQNKRTEILVTYDHPTQTVTFRWKYPFVHTPYEIKGYSLPNRSSNSTLSIANLQSLINEFKVF